MVDAMGCYPLFFCSEWMGLDEDIKELDRDRELVSIVIVTPPFCPLKPEQLTTIFPDLCRPLKEHHIVFLDEDWEKHVTYHHRRNSRWALQRVLVERLADPTRHLDVWAALYDNLIQRRNIRGIARFGRMSFSQQLEVPGLVAFRAVQGNEILGMVLWYAFGENACYHLGAYSEKGYELKAGFAIFWEAINFFSQLGLRRLDLGGGAGAFCDGQDGLSRFKRGWARGVAPAYLCGRVLDRLAYAQLTAGINTEYFPAYRAGEFG